MSRLLALLCFLAMTLQPVPVFAADKEGYGLSERLQQRIASMDAEFEAQRLAFLPDFRLVKTLEAFPDIEGRTLDIVLDLAEESLQRVQREGSPPAIATVHDRRTAAPLGNCELPCTLTVPLMPPGIVTIYRYGNEPREIAVETLAMQQASEPVYLAFGEVDFMFARKDCHEAFEEILVRGEDGDADPCFRAPAPMPSKALHSGHCTAAFDVTDQGDVINLIVDACTEPVFCEPSQAAIGRWVYHPKMEGGRAVARPGVGTKMIFRLADWNGEIIPEPEGDLQPCIGAV
ncbi:MAG: hypothetical protein WBF53_14390 [Litorimonas sp.]